MSVDETRLGDAVTRVWPDGASEWEVLGGGITNHNVKVTRPDGVFVLRVAGRDTDLLGIDRSVELAATRAAEAAGVGPHVVDFVEPEGWLVTGFVEGAIPPPERLREPAQLERVAAALRSFHGGAAIPGRFDALEVVEAYRDTAVARGATLPDAFADAHDLARRIAERRAGQEPRPCHNDLLNANFIDDGERLVIVDWEYAGMGDPFFDLANFSINHELDAEGRAVLLAAYTGDASAEGLAALDLMRFMSDFREAMWGVVQGVVSELDFDFGAYATEHFERMERTATSPGSARRCSALRRRGAPHGAPSSDRTNGTTSLRTPYRREPRTRRRLLLQRSSSSSVPIRTGPLNQFFAEMSHQPPKRRPCPPNRERGVVRRVPVEVVLPRETRLHERNEEEDRDDGDPDDRDRVDPLVVVAQAPGSGSNRVALPEAEDRPGG